ncbi:hypothetical protein GCM10010921_06260 [Microbacterium album]|uniref:Uncharacterized protein n=1 Tax=Microbacterium album TaxID=2053191 RepID=A0A917MKL8_9MICO|nr:hypothetical protein GCM10010921_06260 [Microbacterium album]
MVAGAVAVWAVGLGPAGSLGAGSVFDDAAPPAAAIEASPELLQQTGPEDDEDEDVPSRPRTVTPAPTPAPTPEDEDPESPDPVLLPTLPSDGSDAVLSAARPEPVPEEPVATPEPETEVPATPAPTPTPTPSQPSGPTPTPTPTPTSPPAPTPTPTPTPTPSEPPKPRPCPDPAPSPEPTPTPADPENETGSPKPPSERPGEHERGDAQDGAVTEARPGEDHSGAPGLGVTIEVVYVRETGAPGSRLTDPGDAVAAVSEAAPPAPEPSDG